MWAAFIVCVLVCGYHYNKCHLPSRYKQNKATGWNAYFDVALKGGEFLISGILLAFIVWILLFIIMFAMNIPSYLFSYTPFSFAHDLFDSRIFGLSMLSATCLSFTILVSVGKAATAKKSHQDPKERVKAFKEIAEYSAIENILLESIDKDLLLLVTLKSRKVYVGMVDKARFSQLDDSVLVLIPFMSGYRDKDTLTFCVEHNYTDHYESNGITLTSEPLSVYQFRHVLPLEQIESFSLFNVDTYESFQKVINERAAETACLNDSGKQASAA